MRFFEYRHIIGFEETNLVGNVYYANHIRWQGRVREMFLHEYAPDVLAMLQENLALVTVHVSCDYLMELLAFDEIVIQMRLGDIRQNRITMLFEYRRQTLDGAELIARGKQIVACMERRGDSLAPVSVPPSLSDALSPFKA